MHTFPIYSSGALLHLQVKFNPDLTPLGGGRTRHKGGLFSDAPMNEGMVQKYTAHVRGNWQK
jgi:hypothetical protein